MDNHKHAPDLAESLREERDYRHDCEEWAMEGLGCAHCNPAVVRADSPAWQPIATAPKDGRVVLIAAVGGPVDRGYWWGEDDTSIGHWFIAGRRGHNNPTHWMPLPDPPDRRLVVMSETDQKNAGAVSATAVDSVPYSVPADAASHVAPCLNCGHTDAHNGYAGGGDGDDGCYDACPHEGCNCGWYTPDVAEPRPSRLIAMLEQAHALMCEAVKRQWDGKPAFTLSIPADQAHDTDLLIGDALTTAILYLKGDASARKFGCASVSVSEASASLPSEAQKASSSDPSTAVKTETLTNRSNQ